MLAAKIPCPTTILRQCASTSQATGKVPASSCPSPGECAPAQTNQSWRPKHTHPLGTGPNVLWGSTVPWPTRHLPGTTPLVPIICSYGEFNLSKFLLVGLQLKVIETIQTSLSFGRIDHFYCSDLKFIVQPSNISSIKLT